MVEIGGFISSVTALFGLLLLPYIYISWEHSITNAVCDKSNGKITKKHRKKKLDEFYNRLSYTGIYSLFETAEHHEKEIDDANITIIEL